MPSALFYGGALQECADRAHTESLGGWDKLPRPGGESFPLLMIGACVFVSFCMYWRCFTRNSDVMCVSMRKVIETWFI